MENGREKKNSNEPYAREKHLLATTAAYLYSFICGALIILQHYLYNLLFYLFLYTYLFTYVLRNFLKQMSMEVARWAALYLK